VEGWLWETGYICMQVSRVTRWLFVNGGKYFGLSGAISGPMQVDRCKWVGEAGAGRLEGGEGANRVPRRNAGCNMMCISACIAHRGWYLYSHRTNLCAAQKHHN
jgi:hypothetical protein